MTHSRHIRWSGVFSAALFLCSCSTTHPVNSDRGRDLVITEDIDRFWEAYDAVRAETDEHRQQELVSELYLDRGSPGLHAMNRARSYRSSEYLYAMQNYTQYLDAVRANTLEASRYSRQISDALEKFRAIYPDARDVPVYFVIGAFRAGGTANDGKLLIGAELAMASSNTPTHEFGEKLAHLPAYIQSGPIDNLIDLNVHEYVHTQQRSTGGVDLLSQALFEGVAEYLSTAAIGRPSRQPAIAYGKENRAAVLAAFERDIAMSDWGDWIWNDADNPFATRDLGYFVGYAIARSYVEAAPNKSAAISRLIELDYSSVCEVADVVDTAAVFDEDVARMRPDTDYGTCG